MALVPLAALSAFEFEFSLPPLKEVVGACDPFFLETPVKAYRRPTRKRGRRDDKTIRKLPSALYFAHEPLDMKEYPASKLTPSFTCFKHRNVREHRIVKVRRQSIVIRRNSSPFLIFTRLNLKLIRGTYLRDKAPTGWFDQQAGQKAGERQRFR